MVTSNGKPLKANQRVAAGMPVTVRFPIQPDHSAMSLPIVYEDADVVVINKPAGMLTHAKGALAEEATVADFIRIRTTDGLDTNRPGIVHRLDRGTSGVMIAAKHTAAKHWLQKQFATRNVKKAYLALVVGYLDEPSALLDLPIERHPKHPQTFRVGAHGKSAQTVYETVRVLPGHTLLKLRPLTGRTHQLRVHMAYLHHPIVGDAVYGTADKALERPFLHAAELELTLPSHQRKLFQAPLPAELQVNLDKAE